MPENKHVNEEELKRLQTMGFVKLKDHLIAEAKAAGGYLSVRQSKGIAGDIMSCATGDDYKWIAYKDEVGERVASRWMNFKHHEELAAA